MVKRQLKRCMLEAATTLPVGLYIVLFPFLKLAKKSKALSERWYSLVFSVVYIWGERPIREMKQALFEDLMKMESSNEDHREKKELRILEVGPGFGGNFKFYPENTQLTTVEINNYLEHHVDKIKELYPNVTIVKSIIGNCENMSQVPDNSYDVVVGTLILCCIHDTSAALREIRRVLSPGGKFFFMENVQHRDDTMKYKLQQLYKPFWRGFTIRCKAGTFDAKKEILDVGFSKVDTKEITVKELPAMLSRFVYGTATK